VREQSAKDASSAATNDYFIADYPVDYFHH